MKELNNHDEIFVSEDWLQMKQGKKLIDKLLNAAVVQVEDQIGESHGIEYKDFAEKDWERKNFLQKQVDKNQQGSLHKSNNVFKCADIDSWQSRRSNKIEEIVSI